VPSLRQPQGNTRETPGCDLVLLTLLCGTLAACGGESSSGSAPHLGVSVDQLTIQAGSNAHVTAFVSNDPSNGGVTWSISCSSANCGSVAPTATASGVATTYMSPSRLAQPKDLTVNITATLVADPAVTAVMQVTVSVREVKPYTSSHFADEVSRCHSVSRDGAYCLRTAS
jgi:hypothetical protein